MKVGRTRVIGILALATLVGCGVSAFGSLDPSRRLEPVDEVSQIYGRYTTDYWFCHELAQERGKDKFKLTPEEEKKLFTLLTTENRVSKAASVTLYSYSRGDAALSKKLADIAPSLLESPNNAVRESGVSLIKFFDIKGQDAKLRQLRNNLRGNRHFTLEDVGLVMALDSYFDLAK